MPCNSSFAAAQSPMSESFSNGLLASSISSLSTTASRHPNPISKTYRQSSTLFLTRRLPESLSTLLPIITPPNSAGNGEPAPITRSSRSTRIKVWSLYLTILNASVEMEPEEGKDTFGNQEWRALCAKVRDGSVWDEVARNGYHGVEGEVDPDVVINLATLLLAHARDQAINQKKLENYLASSNLPSLDLLNRLNGSPPRRHRSPAKGTNGADTPRDLNARVKIIELYTLHVLPRNSEWDYAREFISVSAVLDEERREAFIQALESLHEEQHEQDRLEREERQRQEEQLQRDIAEARRLKDGNQEKERKRLGVERLQREGSEVDYGVEQTPSPTGVGKASPPTPSPGHISRPKSVQTSSGRSKGKTVSSGPLTLSARASLAMTRMRTLVDQLTASLNSNLAIAMRFLAFVMGLILMFGHRATRARVRQMLGASWAKVQATVGMGTKVSYI